MSEAKMADQNPFTANLSDHTSVRDNIAALITKINNPKVTIETGKVKTLIIEPKNALINPKSSATQR